MKKITKITGAVGMKLRGPQPAGQFRLLEIGRAARAGQGRDQSGQG